MPFSPIVWTWSLAHAATQTYFALPFALSYLWGHQPTPEWYPVCISLFSIHIAVDSILHWTRLRPSMKLHHVLTFAAAAHNYVAGAPEPAMVLLANETSTVFYSGSKLLPPGRSKTICRRLFATTFFTTRILMNSALLLKQDAPLSQMERFTLSALLMLNVHWFGRGLLAAKRAT